MIRIIELALAILILFSCSDKPNKGKDEIPDFVFPSAHALNASLGHGINLGNALDAPKEGDWGVTLNEDYFEMIADFGFNTVRIPMRWSAHASSKSPYAIDTAFLNRARWAVDVALSKGLNVIINFHHYTEIMADPSGQEERFLALWKQVSKAFETYPPQLIFEILNEPKDSLSSDRWNALLVKAIDTIRVRHPERTLMVGTSQWGGIAGLQSLELPEDTNLIVTVHYYEPHSFTHQGAAWEAGSDAWLGKTWRATPAQRSVLDNDLKRITDWATSHNRPIYLGEFGTYFKVDSVSRAFYTETIVRKMDSLGISWAYWNFSSDFGIYNDTTGVVHAYLTQALLHPGNNESLDSALESGIQVDLTKYLPLDDFEGHADHKGLTLTGWDWVQAKDTLADSSDAHWYVFYSDSSRMNSAMGDSLINILDILDTNNIDSNFKSNTRLAVGPWGFSGDGFQVKAKIKGSNYPFIGFGAAFTGWDDPSHYYDLCSLTALSFKAKGKGEWVVHLITDTVDNDYEKGQDWGNFQYHFTLTDQWEDYVVSVDLLTPKPWSPQEADGLVWKDGCMYTNAIEFQSGQSYGEMPDDSLDITIDDVRLIGITSLKPNPPTW